MINNTTLVGRLTKDPDLKYTGSGKAVTNFTLAVERNFTNAQGERETDFINCVAWRGTAENLTKFALSGSLIGITGAIQTRTYENNQGQTVYVTEVLVDNFQMLEPKSVTDARRNGGNRTGGQQNQQQSQQPANDNPFANINTSDDVFDQSNVNNVEDEFPF